MKFGQKVTTIELRAFLQKKKKRALFRVKCVRESTFYTGENAKNVLKGEEKKWGKKNIRMKLLQARHCLKATFFPFHIIQILELLL